MAVIQRFRSVNFPGMGCHGLPGCGGVPDCKAVSARRHDTVLARPRGVRRAAYPVTVWWVKFRWKCDAPGCDRETFTERVPQVPPRCRLTARLRERAGAENSPRSHPQQRHLMTEHVGPIGASA